MIHYRALFRNAITMTLNCPECKNNIDLSSHEDIMVDTVLECTTCGISLAVTAINDGVVEAEIVDEGK